MKRSKIITIVVLAVICVAMAALALTGTIEAFEPTVHKFLNGDAETSEFFYSFTVLGDTVLDIFIIVLLLCLPFTTKKLGIPVASATIVSTVLNKVIKTIVARPRPDETLRLLEIGGYSFPSGHAMNNAAIYITIMLCLLPLCKNKFHKGIVIAIFTLIPFIIGISRVYFNVHFISDVVCGWCLGAIVALVVSEFFKPKKEALNGKN